jgi:hypothetical protein
MATLSGRRSTGTASPYESQQCSRCSALLSRDSSHNGKGESEGSGRVLVARPRSRHQSPGSRPGPRVRPSASPWTTWWCSFLARWVHAAPSMPGRDRSVVDGDISCPSVGRSDNRPWGVLLVAYGEFRVAAVRVQGPSKVTNSLHRTALLWTPPGGAVLSGSEGVHLSVLCLAGDSDVEQRPRPRVLAEDHPRCQRHVEALIGAFELIQLTWTMAGTRSACRELEALRVRDLGDRGVPVANDVLLRLCNARATSTVQTERDDDRASNWPQPSPYSRSKSDQAEALAGPESAWRRSRMNNAKSALPSALPSSSDREDPKAQQSLNQSPRFRLCSSWSAFRG